MTDTGDLGGLTPIKKPIVVKRPKPPKIHAEQVGMYPVLSLEAVGGPVILAEGGEGDSGTMKVKVPFYVGNSAARIGGFSKKVYFPEGILASIVSKGNAQIAEHKMPLSVYARHTDRINKELPVGTVTGLAAEGRVGYATIEIAATQRGRDVQALIKAGHVNSSSLATERYTVADKKVNGELMSEVAAMDLDGIDFAPDGPAMPTYGVEVLAAEAVIEPAPTTDVPGRNQMSDVTVDGLRAEHSQIVAKIEAEAVKPLMAEVETLRAKLAERDKAERIRERDAFIGEIAAKFPDPAVALPELQKLCAEAESKDEVAAKAMPLLLEVLNNQKPAKPEPTPSEKLLELFTPGGRGKALQAEHAVDEEQPNIGGFAVPAN